MTGTLERDATAIGATRAWVRDIIRRRPHGIRTRITAIAAAAVAMVLAGAAVTLLVAQRRQLTGAIDASLAQRADDLTALIASGGDMPTVLPATGDDGTVAQILAADGTVIAASRGMGAPIGRDLPETTEAFRTVPVPAFDDPFRLLTRRVRSDAGAVVLHVGANLDDVHEAISTLGVALTAVVPVATLTLAAVVWWLVGRTLQPVEAIRSEVAAIGGRDLHRRVPRPQTGDEIDLLARTMNEMLDRLEDAVQRQQRLVADASHELRTPLTRIRTEVEIELVHGVGEDHAALLRSVLDETAALQQLVNDLLHLARSDAGASRLQSQPLDLDDIVLREARRLRENGRVTVDSSGVSAASISGDPEQLGRAVRNLTANAERHAATSVSLTLTERGDHAWLVVVNDGPPIPEDQRERIFERFTRLDDARVRDAGGTGLGLAITRDIIEQHGGSVRVDPERDRGAAFEVVLPLDEITTRTQPSEASS
ncbi:MAG TPA: ATP-binding protein [Euzebyales bacterium]|nr:ATP-binding protein [Euzebyales bacterium]